MPEQAPTKTTRMSATEKRAIINGTRYDAKALVMKVRAEFQGFHNPMNPRVTVKVIDGEEWICVGTRFRINVRRDTRYGSHWLLDTENNHTTTNGLDVLCRIIHYRYLSPNDRGVSILRYSMSTLKSMVKDKMITWAYLHRLNTRRYLAVTREATVEFKKTQTRLRRGMVALNESQHTRKRRTK
jgi:hypothetical protein